MDAAELKEIQTPIKARYRDDPDAAIITLKAQGAIGEGVTCSVETGLTASDSVGGDGFETATGWRAGAGGPDRSPRKESERLQVWLLLKE